MFYCVSFVLVFISFVSWFYRVFWVDRLQSLRWTQIKATPLRAISLIMLFFSIIANLGLHGSSMYVSVTCLSNQILTNNRLTTGKLFSSCVIFTRQKVQIRRRYGREIVRASQLPVAI